MNIVPLFDRVVVKKLDQEKVTASGIVLPTKEENKSNKAVVLAVGPGEYDDGVQIPMQVKVGDIILFPQYAGNPFTIDGEDIVILTQKDILAIIKE